jgi:1,4-alpha-glucan branching enzyme/maltooligosyltrehalose trehalohydrolase
MPFGAELHGDGRVRFRLWAPAAARVDVCLDGTGTDGHASQTVLPMAAEPEGWFGLNTARAGPGTRYRFRIDGEALVPDPASRYQPQDVHGASTVIDPAAWRWQDADWHGRPWEETVLYELHVGCFSARGSFAGVQDKLDYLAGLGVTAIELMPVADFPGKRNWGYDGVYLFAPDSRYGSPDELKALVQAAHARGLMVFLDVVYNHFGPEGNYLHVYAPQFFTRRHRTPWGAGINYDGKASYWVRQFFIHNALYWLEEYHLDGLRLDAVHAIADDSQPDILTELAASIRKRHGNGRHIHLVLENDHNAARYLGRDSRHRPRCYAAQWNDDIHHALHVLLTGERDGYYLDYADQPLKHLARCLAEGFAYQGEASAYRGNTPRGEPSAHLPATAFVSFLQNHDQVGNRAFGERLGSLCAAPALRAALGLLLLAPSPPLLFMGQEWGCTQPFPFFCDFGPDLADRVAAGRREEFARFAPFRTPAARARIPDPMASDTFAAAVLDWQVPGEAPHRDWLALHRELLALRRRELMPRLAGLPARRTHCTVLGSTGLCATWILGDGSEVTVVANLGEAPLTGVSGPAGSLLYANPAARPGQAPADRLPPWSVYWYLQPGDGTQ